MKLLNHQYFDKDILNEFINKNHIPNTSKTLLQVFTAINKKRFIEELLKEIKELLPKIKIIGATTSGEISSNGVSDDTTILSFALFEDTKIETYICHNHINSFETGQKLIKGIEHQDIKGAICFSDGLHSNGEELLNGISSINKKIIIAGGMASDYSRFEDTFVFTQDGITDHGAVLATLDNPNLIINTTYSFNWDTLGVKHIVTRSEKNRIYTIGDKTAVEFYKYYFGEKIEKLLPAIGIEFPLVIEENDLKIARAVIEKHDDGSLSFAGNIDEGTLVQFGYGNINKILKKSLETTKDLKNKPIQGLFIYSCMARHALLKENSDLEIDPLKNISEVSGFFTNGEFYKKCTEGICKNYLLNETMTIMALSESKNTIKEDDKISPYNFSNYDLLEIHRIEALSQFITRVTGELENLNNNLQIRVEEELQKNNEKEKKLQVANTQAQIGSMMEMILHQWRQPLNGILTAASGIQLRSELDMLTKEELADLTANIINLTNHANETIEDFRSIFDINEKRKLITPKEVINKSKQILKSLLSKNSVKFEESYNCEGKGELNIPGGQLLQVIIIIVKNAVDAIIENNITHPVIRIDVSKDDQYCILAIEDNAGGINEDILEKIFEKRFTTKASSHGTGLGLDICKTIIEKNMKGNIKASNIRSGAIFHIKIPHNQ